MIIQNAIQVGNTIINSKHRHDFVECGEFFVDGGLEYIRTGYPPEKTYTSLKLDIRSSMEEICEKLICEKLNRFWKDLTRDELFEERNKIMGWYLRTNDEVFYSFTMNHAMLHFYVSGYWIVRKGK